MQTMSGAMRAYQASATHRSLRQQEADVFRFANGGLRGALAAGAQQRVRAIADNRRLWTTVLDLMCDPENALPETLRASIISVGLAVQREMEQPHPDIGFLIEVNENIAAGLSGQD